MVDVAKSKGRRRSNLKVSLVRRGDAWNLNDIFTQVFAKTLQNDYDRLIKNNTVLLLFIMFLILSHHTFLNYCSIISPSYSGQRFTGLLTVCFVKLLMCKSEIKTV